MPHAPHINRAFTVPVCLGCAFTIRLEIMRNHACEHIRHYLTYRILYNLIELDLKYFRLSLYSNFNLIYSMYHVYNLFYSLKY